MSEFKKWQSINKFSDAYHMAQKFGIGKVRVGLKIKLHGTNGAIRVEKGGMLVAQKRTSDVTVDADNAGFARYVSELEVNSGAGDYFEGIIIHGEWAGKGVQKTDAVSQTPKTFYVFALENVKHGILRHDPESIRYFLERAFSPESSQLMKVIPWYKDILEFSFADQKSAQEAIDYIVAEVDDIAKSDPYIKSEWDVDGPGEGLVGTILEMQKQDGTAIDFELHRDYTFKVKTLEHSVQKNKDRTKTGPEKPEGVDDFINMFFTENRFQQMLDEHCGGVADRKQTGVFMKAVMSDVHKESVNEIEIADFEWKDVPKFATNSVRQWFFDQCDKL